MPARYLPTAIRDETGAFIRQMAQGNEALARLYTQLLAQYEARQENQAFQREMYGLRSADADRRSADSDQRWFDRTNYVHNLRNPQAPQGPNLLGPGAAGPPSPRAPAAAVAPTSAAPTAAPARPSVYTIDNNPFNKGAGVNAPATPAPQAAIAGGDAFAQAGAGDTDFSAQSRKPLPTVEQPPNTPRREPASSTQLPTQPRVTAKTAQTRPQAAFLDVDQRWLDLMHQMEDEYKLPRGTMMTVYGMENGGGRQFGRNPTSRSPNPPEGIFQFAKELRDQYKLTNQDIYNPEKMIRITAYNMRRNADILEQNHKIKLPLTPQAIPMFVGLHQWGSGAGPRAVAAYIQNPDAPMATVMGTHKDAKGNVLNNFTILAANGHNNPNITVKQALQNKAMPWYSAYSQQFTEHAHSPQGKYVSIPAPAPQVAQTPQVGDPSAPRPPANIPQNTMGTHPRLAAAVNGGASLVLPEGYTLRQTSGARPHGRTGSHHHRGNAGDWQIYTPDGRPIPNRGHDTTGLYTMLARGVKTWVRENDPELEKRIGYGGAFETSRGSRTADLMHFDLGGSRGRLVPEAQFARLQPLSAEERTTRVAQQPQQPQKPVKVAGPVPTPDAPPIPPARAIMPAISRIPTSPEVAATFDNKIATAGFDRRTPDAAATLGPEPVKAGAGTLAARSDLDYNAPPEVATTPITPQASTLQARSDLDYGAAPPSKEPIKWGDELTPSIAGTTPPDMEVTPPERGAAPVTTDDSMFATVTPPAAPIPQRLDAGTVAKEPLPSEFTSATPQQATPDPMLGGAMPPDYFKLTPELDVATATPREALPPGFKVPWPPLGGDSAGSAIASAPSGQMPRDMQLPAQLPPSLSEPPQPSGPPTIQRIRDAIYSGNIPGMNTATDPTRENEPLGQSARQWLANPKFLPDTPNVEAAIAPKLAEMADTRSQMMDELRAGLPELRESWNTIPTAAKQAIQSVVQSIPPDRQLQFARAVAEWAKGGQGVVGTIQDKLQQWMAKPDALPPKQHPTAQVPQSSQSPPRTLPDGSPYIPPPEPLNVPPPASARGPTNTTLSGGPVQGGGVMPAAPGQKVNPMTGRPDRIRVQMPDGSVQYRTPEEMQQLQETVPEPVQEPE